MGDEFTFVVLLVGSTLIGAFGFRLLGLRRRRFLLVALVTFVDARRFLVVLTPTGRVFVRHGQPVH